MRQVAGHSAPRIDKALTAEASTCPACLDSAVLESLQWADLPAFEGLVSRSGEADEGWTLHTLSRCFERADGSAWLSPDVTPSARFCPCAAEVGRVARL